ncbi:MAG: hypothetical protein M3Y40_07825, partial [Chloroflexota bacterium]|nr:hypothetical protein [Chloroflexota bacterium]
RVALDRLLAEHAFLTVQALEAGITDDDQFAAAAAAHEANTAELEGAIADIYDATAGERFGDLWRAHIGYVVDYTRATQAGDEAAEQSAVEALDAYQDEFVAFLSEANPRLSAETLHHLLEDHLGQLQQVAKLQAGDYEAVYDTARSAYGHMFELGDGLARGISEQFPSRFSGRGVAFGPAFDLQLSLDRLLGEHAFFAVEVMRLADGEPAHQRAASDALASNGRSLSEAIGEIYGEEAGRAFAEIWEEHNGYYVDYVRAALDGDESAADIARAGLETFSDRASRFFAEANDQLDREAVRSGLAAHTEHLVQQVEAHAAGDYAASFAIGREAHAHMGAVSNLLATGIAKQFPTQFLPDTAVRPTSLTTVIGWLLVAVAIGALLRAMVTGGRQP